MTDYWKSIENRLHEESALHYPSNKLRLILESFINGSLTEAYENTFDFILESFLISCTGRNLDNRGAEAGISRNTGESDASYRQRLFNAISAYLSVNFVKSQGNIIYTKGSVDEKIRERMTSNNPYLNNKYAIIPRNNSVSNFVENEIVNKDVFQVYKRGW